MRSIFSASAALLLAGTMLSGAAWAQTAVTPRQEQAGLPAGAYLLSCTHPHMTNGQLVALCDSQTSATEAQDTWHWARLANAAACTGEVENVNGELTCGMGPMVGSSTPPQYYDSSFGNSGSSYAPPSAATGPYVPPYETGAASAFPGGQPVPPANRSYHSATSQAEWGTPPHHYGSGLTRTPPSYGSWQQPAYYPSAQQPVYEPARPSAVETTTPPSYGSWQQPAYRPAVPPAQ